MYGGKWDSDQLLPVHRDATHIFHECDLTKITNPEKRVAGLGPGC